jgi:Mg2+/Co2+ transporter CorB
MLLGSILKLREHRVGKILIPLGSVYMIDIDSRLDKAKIQELKEKEFSFVPVYREKRTNIVAILKTKEFVAIAANKLNHGKAFKEFVQ